MKMNLTLRGVASLEQVLEALWQSMKGLQWISPPQLRFQSLLVQTASPQKIVDQFRIKEKFLWDFRQVAGHFEYCLDLFKCLLFMSLMF